MTTLKKGDRITFAADGSVITLPPRAPKKQVLVVKKKISIDKSITYDPVVGNYVLVTWDGKDCSARVLKEYPTNVAQPPGYPKIVKW